MNLERPIVTPADIERYRLEARALQSREIARLCGRLFRAPARLVSRLRARRAVAPRARAAG